MKRILCALSVLALVVSACSSDDDKGGDAPTTTGPAASTPATTAAPDTTTPGTEPGNDADADLAIAEAAVLQAADLPGFTATPHQPAGELSQADRRAFADCLGADTTIFDDTPGSVEAYSDDFERDRLTVESSVNIHPTAATITERFEQFSQGKTAECFGALYEKTFAERLGGSAGVTVNATPFDPNVGEMSVGFSLEILVTSDNQEFAIYAERLLAARDRAGLDVRVFNETGPVDRNFSVGLLRTMYERIGDQTA